jgi:hypothetical protein
MTTKTAKIKRSNGPFGLIDGDVPLFQFDGTPQDLMAAMEKSFVIPKKKKTKQTKPDKTKSKPVIPPGLAIKKVVRRKGSRKKVLAVKPFDRNRDGATTGELERAQHLITNVTAVSPEQRQAYAKSLQSLTRELTEFLLVEIAPYESAIDAALDDAADSVRIITGVQHASFSMGRADALLRRLPELKTLDWVCKRLTMPEDIRSLVINEYMGTNDKKSSNLTDFKQQLSQLLQANGLPRPQEGPRSRMQRTQTRTVGRPAVDARSAKD